MSDEKTETGLSAYTAQMLELAQLIEDDPEWFVTEFDDQMLVDALRFTAAARAHSMTFDSIERAFDEWRKMLTIVDNPSKQEIFGQGYIAGWTAKEAVSIAATDEEKQSSAGSEPIPLADHDEIGRKVVMQPWAVQSSIVPIAAHCRVLVDKHPTGDVADLAGCISQDLLGLANALSAPAQSVTLTDAMIETIQEMMDRGEIALRQTASATMLSRPQSTNVEKADGDQS